jgi:hypothetical protein
LTAREYLKQLNDIDLEIQAKERQKSKLEKRKYSLSSPSFGERVSSTHQNNSNKIIDEIETLQQSISESIAALVEIEANVTRGINSLHNPTYRMILTEKYINGIPLSEIASEKYCERQIKRLHKKALKSLTVICGLDEDWEIEND